MKHNWLKWLVWVILSSAAINISFSLLVTKAIPFWGLGFIWTLVPISAFILASHASGWRLLWLYTSVAFITFSGYEAYLSIPGSDSGKPSITSRKPTKRDNLLGYSPLKNNQFTKTKFYKEQVVFKATYSFNEYGLRASPPFNNDSLIGDCLFFGCSYTLGEGVEDDETFPYQVGLLTKGQYRIHNFAFNGYGPHQMLAALEYGTVREVVPNDEKTKHGFFLTFPHHALRAAGWIGWDVHGPRYLLNTDGSVSLNGTFYDNIIIRGLRQSKILYNRLFNYENISSEQIELYAEIIAASEDKFKAFYPDGKFYVLFINRQTKLSQKLLSALQQKELKILSVNEILSDPAPYSERFRVHKYDPHPNALANKLIASFIAEKILLKKDHLKEVEF